MRIANADPRTFTNNHEWFWTFMNLRGLNEPSRRLNVDRYEWPESFIVKKCTFSIFYVKLSIWARENVFMIKIDQNIRKNQKFKSDFSFDGRIKNPFFLGIIHLYIWQVYRIEKVWMLFLLKILIFHFFIWNIWSRQKVHI